MFKKEDRYLVIKRSDVQKYLGARDRTQLNTVLEKIDVCRRLDGRGNIRCVVVESDWDCYSDVWDLVEKEYNDSRR
jgi:hypothetical protein